MRETTTQSLKTLSNSSKNLDLHSKKKRRELIFISKNKLMEKKYLFNSNQELLKQKKKSNLKMDREKNRRMIMEMKIWLTFQLQFKLKGRQV
jgi:hypothetical protein